MMAAWAIPTNNPCSTTPGISARRAASDAGSGMRSSAASTIRCPLSVTKGWPSRVRRSKAGPGQPASTAAFSILRRMAANPNATTSIGSGKRPEHVDQFGIISNYHHAGGRRRHNLLAQQRAPAALDQAQARADLVGAVDREVEFRRFIQGRQRNSMGVCLRPRRLRGRNADNRQPAPYPFGQKLDEVIGGRP